MSDAGLFTIGVFQDTAWAQRGIDALLQAGFPGESLSVIAKPSPEAASLIQSALGREAHEVEVKGLGAILIAGPLTETLQGGAQALTTDGLAAAMRRAGYQSHDGRIFQRLVERGGTLVAVRSEPRAADALAKLHAFGAGNAAIGAWVGRV